MNLARWMTARGNACCAMVLASAIGWHGGDALAGCHGHASVTVERHEDVGVPMLFRLPEQSQVGPDMPTLSVGMAPDVVMEADRAEDSPALTDLAVAQQAEARRIEMIERVSPAVVCIFDTDREGGGSGVLIDERGYGLTNFHVVAGMMATRRGLGGLSDGTLYPLEVLGIDPTGDVAMFRLTGREVFPAAKLGDSDAVRIGDSAVAMGNPFVVSEDFTPSVSLGIVTGTHRYQWGVGTQLVYSDCIQTDASVNPGNSGGPLFNAAGEVIGINGRISVNTRGRFNVGFGYAISINQIKRFIPALRAGLLAKHGTLQATVDDIDGHVIFDEMMHDAPAHDVGIRVGDRLIRFDGHLIKSRNHFASLLGIYPADWPVSIEFEREGHRRTRWTRLEAISPRLEHPFEVDPKANARQVRRVVRDFRRAVFGDEAPVVAKEISWRIVRTRAGDDVAGEPNRYQARWQLDRPIRVQRVVEGAARGEAIEFDDQRAVKLRDDGGEPFDLPAERRMVLGARYLLWRLLAADDALIEKSGASHVGGDAPFPVNQAASKGDADLLEVLDWPIGGHAVVRLSFDVRTHRAVRAVVRDLISGDEVTLLLSQYREMGGLNWPSVVEVFARDAHHRDEISDVEVIR